MFYALICINNHVFSRLIIMLWNNISDIEPLEL